MYSQTQIDPMVSFRNSQGDSARGTIINLQRKSLVMEVYNPYSIVQVSEVLSDLNIRLGDRNAYTGRAVITNIVNTGLTAIVSLTLIDEWSELNITMVTPDLVRNEAQAFVSGWSERFKIRKDYQLVVNEMTAFLSDASRWVEQVDLSDNLPKNDNKLREDYFYELAIPLAEKTEEYLKKFEYEASLVDQESSSAHRAFAQAALHPFLLRAPFVFRTYTKPLGYAGDYEMVNQMLNDPRQGPNTYFQIVNASFLKLTVAVAHINRIDILTDYLTRIANIALQEGKQFKILNVGCGPAVEIQRFLQTFPNPEALSFQLIDFSDETLAWTREKLTSIMSATGRPTSIEYIHNSVHNLLKRKIDLKHSRENEFNAVYCAGLFDYLSDKVCSRLISYFVSRTKPNGKILFTNVHSNNPEKFGMEHLLEWYLIYRDEAKMEYLLPQESSEHLIYTDATGVNVFAEITVS